MKVIASETITVKPKSAKLANTKPLNRLNSDFVKKKSTGVSELRIDLETARAMTPNHITRDNSQEKVESFESSQPITSLMSSQMQVSAYSNGTSKAISFGSHSKENWIQVIEREIKSIHTPPSPDN